MPSVRWRSIFLSMLTWTLLAALVPIYSPTTTPAGAADANGLFPWQIDDDGPPGAQVGTGFDLTIPDLNFILDQIKISEQHVGPTFDPLNPCANIIGNGPNQINAGGNAEQLPFGLRTLNGICNNLVPGREKFGATYEPFIHLLTPEWRSAGDSTPLGGGQTTYVPDLPNPPTGFGSVVYDAEPRIISNLIVDQTNTNPAAVAAAGIGAPDPGPGVSYDIENVAPDLGISRPYSTALTFFGQFFDHGLDLTTKSGEVVFMPLQPDDPLIGIVPPGLEFMLMGRSVEPGIPTFEPVNEASPYVDQNQTYTSDPSQQMWQREYVGNPPLENGRLLAGVGGSGLTTWADVKAQALNLLGFELQDTDIVRVPLMRTNLYGAFIPGPNGLPQMITGLGVDGIPQTADDVLVEGNLAVPVSTATALSAGHVWLADIAHSAVPGGGKVPDSGAADLPGGCNPSLPGSQLTGYCDDGDPTTYDNEMLDAHFICGDGRCNENIGLSAIHHVFHSEHNRLVQQIKDELTANATPAFLAEWQTSPGVWDGKRLFQAAKFGTEMQYQHLAFEEFARTVQPNVDAFAGYDTTVDASIMAEFAHAVYRFGHTMLTEQIDRYDTATGAYHPVGLIDAFLNPPEFFQGTTPGDAGAFAKAPDEAAGGIIAGLVSANGQEMDEFVVEALRNNLVGLPLDLAAINIARGRDAGIPRLNSFRAQIMAMTGSTTYAPYANWLEFRLSLSTPESLVNFIAAYGTDISVTSATNNADRRAAANVLLLDNDFINGTGPWTGVNTGVDDIDTWVGGLAEKQEFFGGLLGPTMNFIFELQMENLQNGDRFYYLHRLAGVPMLAKLEANSLSELIERNTTADKLAANVFATPTYTFDLDIVHPDCISLVDDPATPYDETALLLLMPDCTVRYPVLEPASIAGRTGATPGGPVPGFPANDKIYGGIDDDSIKGNDGDDRIEGGEGNDVIIGGNGDDIITDILGIDVLKGGPGDDAIDAGPGGGDLILGGSGGDFLVLGTDFGEVIAGSGNDIVIGGTGADVIFGDDGDDWVTGGGQADLVQGDTGAPFQNNPTNSDGHDVLDGGGGNDDYDAEGGDDILLAGEGTERFEGQLGFDWVTHKNDPQPAVSDLNKIGLLPPDVGNLVDRFDFVEGLSGYNLDDVLRGDDLRPVDLGGNPADNALDQAGIARITNLDQLLPPGAISWGTGGNIILGGAGSDLIEGRGEDDIIDGDAWLNVMLDPDGAGPLPPVDTPEELQAGVFDGTIDPGDITIVREIVWAAPGGDIDTAEFDGPRADYDIVENVDGSLTVTHARNLGAAGNCPDIDSICDDGTDTLFNIERLAFSDVIIGAPCADCLLRVTTVPPVASQIIVDGSPTDRWGLTWMKTSPGAHEVCFTDVEGWATAPCETVNVSPGVTGVVNGAFTQQGFIHVVTSPAVQSTISIDGVVRNDWAVWTDFPVGPHEVCYGDVAGFTTPACETLNVVAGATTDFTGTFVPGAAVAPTGQGLLRVTTSSTLGGGVASQISIDGVTADRWGLNWVKMPPGVYEVCYGDVPNHTTPACSTEVVVAGQTTVANGAFEARGILRVLTQTPHQSTIFVDDVPRNDWGLWSDLPVGPHVVCFGEANGFTPACQAINLVAGVQTTVTGTWP